MAYSLVAGMKTLFLTLFFLILVAFCGLAGIIVAQIPPRSWNFESIATVGLDLAEGGAAKLTDYVGSKPQELLAEKLGQCQPMTLPRGPGVDSIGNLTPVEGVAPFSRPIPLASNSLLCGFPGKGKSVLLIPERSGKVILRRRPNSPGSLEYAGDESSRLLVVSDELNFDVLVPGTLVHLQSKGPLSLVLEYSKAQAKLFISGISGEIEFSITSRAANADSTLIVFIPSPTGTISSQGKIFTPHATVRILPSGIYVAGQTEPVAGISAAGPILLSSFLSLPPSDDPNTPQRSALSVIHSKLIDVSSRASLLLLNTSSPALFPIHFLCGFTAPKSKLVSVLPGEWIDAPEGGTLQCPGGYLVKIEKGSRMRLRQSDALPEFILASGKIGVSSGVAKDYFVALPGFTAGIRGQAKLETFLFSATPQESVLTCTGGIASASVRRTNQLNVKSLLSIRDCKTDVYFGQSGPARTLFNGDNVNFENLAITRVSWPSVPTPDLDEFGDTNPDFLSFPFTQSAEGKVSWQLPPSMLNANCTLLAQTSDFTPLTEQSKFKGTAKGEAQLSADYHRGFAELTCEKDGVTAFSSLLQITGATPPK